MDLLALADFNAVAMYGGFSSASRATGTPKATLSRRVRALEAELGVRLLERDTRVLRLTQEGRVLTKRTAHLLSDIAEAGEEISGCFGQPRGRLRLSVPHLFAPTSLGKVAAAFVAAYPEVALDIVVEDRFADPVAEDIDIVVRVNPSPNTDLVGHCLLRGDLVVAASPAIAMPVPSLESVPAVVLASSTDGDIWHLETPGGQVEVRPRPILRCSSMVVVRDAVLAGAGAAMMPRWLVEPEVESGNLAYWGKATDREIEVWALHTSRRQVSPKISAFMTMLRQTEFE